MEEVTPKPDITPEVIGVLKEFIRDIAVSGAGVMLCFTVVALLAGEDLPWWSIVVAAYLSYGELRRKIAFQVMDAMNVKLDAVASSLNIAHQAHTMNGEMIHRMLNVEGGAKVDAAPGLH